MKIDVGRALFHDPNSDRYRVVAEIRPAGIHGDVAYRLEHGRPQTMHKVYSEWHRPSGEYTAGDGALIEAAGEVIDNWMLSEPDCDVAMLDMEAAE